MDYRGINRRGALILIGLLLLIIAAIVWWINYKPLQTGNTVPVTTHPYQQLAYTKLAYQGGNFVGDVYLLDVDSGETTQLTQGGETAASNWWSPEILDIYHRPRGSVMLPYHLNVNRGTLSEAFLPLTFEPAHLSRSADGQRLVTELIQSNTWNSQGYVVIDIADGQAKTLLNLPDASTLPQWLPDSESIVYERYGKQICIRHLDGETQDCLTGSNPTLSATVSPILLAYTTNFNDVYQLCVAHITDHRFTHTQCYDQNAAQIINLRWRP